MLSLNKIMFSKSKLLIATFILLLLGGSSYYLLKNNKNNQRYVFTTVKRGDLKITVSGTGNVLAADEVVLTPKVGGELAYIGVKNGQFIKAQTLIAKVDSRDQEKIVKNSELALQAAQLSLEQAQKGNPQDENLLKAQALELTNSAINNTKNIINSLNDIFFTDISDQKLNIRYLIEYYNNIVRYYAPADADYNKIITQNFNLIKEQNNLNHAHYSQLSQNSSLEEIKKILNEVGETTKTVSDTVHLGYQLLNRYQNILSDNNLIPNLVKRNVASDINTLNNEMTTIDTLNNNLLNLQKSINTFTNNSQGTNSFTLQSLKLNVEQQKNNLEIARAKLRDYYLYAPFDGYISQLNVNVGDNISSGTAIAVLITKQKVVELNLNELDAAKIKIGQKAKLTFDALPNVIASGTVIEIDPNGVINNGVVSYPIKISLDDNNEEIKAGMSVTAEITIKEKKNILLLPSAALKSNDKQTYVEILEGQQVKQKIVEIGDTNNQFTEIVSGLNEGDKVILKILTKINSFQTTAQTRNFFQMPGFSPSRTNIKIR